MTDALALIAIGLASGLLIAALIRYLRRRADKWNELWLEMEQRDEADHRAATAIIYNADGQPLGLVSDYGKRP